MLFYFLLKVQFLKTIVEVTFFFLIFCSYFFLIVDFGPFIVRFMPDWLTVDNDLNTQAYTTAYNMVYIQLFYMTTSC